MLVPILGLHFILLPMRPEAGSALEPVYEVVSAVTSSFQVRSLLTTYYYIHYYKTIVRQTIIRHTRKKPQKRSLEVGRGTIYPSGRI